jgi:hypothetical protein
MDIDVDGEYPILRYATADMLLAHENEAYLESRGEILSQQEEISKLTIKHQYLQYVPVCTQTSELSPPLVAGNCMTKPLDGYGARVLAAANQVLVRKRLPPQPHTLPCAAIVQRSLA